MLFLPRAARYVFSVNERTPSNSPLLRERIGVSPLSKGGLRGVRLGFSLIFKDAKHILRGGNMIKLKPVGL